MCGTNYMPVLLADTTMESIPECLGGTFKLFNEPFEFDCSVGGPLHYPGAPPDPKQGPAGAGSATSSTSTSTSNTGHHGDHPSSTGAQKGVGGRPAGGVSTLFPDMDSDGFPPAARTSPRLAPLLERTFSGNGSCGSASGSGSGSGSTHQQTTRTRSGSGTALGRVSMNGKPLDVEGMSHGVVQHIASWVRNNPLKAGLTLVWAVIFAWVRSTGWLQLMVYPAIVYVTIFDTKAIVRSILSHFDIELKARSTVK